MPGGTVKRHHVLDVPVGGQWTVVGLVGARRRPTRTTSLSYVGVGVVCRGWGRMSGSGSGHILRLGLSKT